MDVNRLLSNILILSGTGLLIYSLYPATKIIAELSNGMIRKQWGVLRLLILFFILGYLGYLAFVNLEHDPSNLIVGVIFFFGAIFVLLVCLLTLKTVKDLSRMDVLQAENITDELTGVYNRRFLERRLENEFAKAQLHKTPLSVLMVDIDHFKKINDLYGHQAGDEVLKCFGNLLRQVTRKMDIIARYGGDEIAILMPNTEQDLAWKIAERIRKTIEEKSPDLQSEFCKGKDIGCTVSIGIAPLIDGTVDGNHLLRMADVALHNAKESGRNCIVIFQSQYVTISTPKLSGRRE